MKKTILLIVSVILVTGCSSLKYNKHGLYFKIPISHVIPKNNNPKILKSQSVDFEIPKSIIFIIADGAGIGHYTAHYYSNQTFSFDDFEHIGLQTTHPANQDRIVTDSAAGGSALATGEKVERKSVSMKNDIALKSVVGWAEHFGMSTGLITTTKVNHATPAAFGSSTNSRYNYDDIFLQLLLSDIDIILGGGTKYWNDTFVKIAKDNNALVYFDFKDIKIDDDRVIGLFADDFLDLKYENRYPTTIEMTKVALEKLEQNESGFFLMVEESQTDWAGHVNNATYIKNEMQSLDDLVKYCLEYQSKNPEVLVVLTADHETGGIAVYDEDADNLNIQYIDSHHSANMVPIFASGPGAEAFDAILDNSEIGKKLIQFVRDGENE
ncbi:MAG: alkaline phosphatase [Candidatus Marinimicrobia bacterium]|nr:alkaline phosphatase [Candidatus Neomarinimicrobiota bacterium]MBL7022624.1 alkaline phosphatase [Candidatus Neomarinimicrobiota bacterium]MBL7109633.1 alkaline phosphatase [Candidatus Neomarinimicrobiota bacterium]